MSAATIALLADLEGSSTSALMRAAYTDLAPISATLVRCELRARAVRLGDALHKLSGGALSTSELERLGSMGCELADLARAIRAAGAREVNQ